MASGNTLLTIDALLKYYYDDGFVNETFMKNPLWALISKKQAMANATGRAFIHPVVYATSQGRNTNFANAQTAGQNTGELSVDFVVQRVNNHQLSTVSTETVLATRDDRGAFTKAITLITDNCLRNLGLDQAISLYGSGSGVRGVIGSIGNPSQSVSNSQITLATAQNANYFEVGMSLDLVASGGSSVRAYGSAGHALYVIAVDRINGVLTIGTTPNPGTATAVAVTDSVNGIPGAVVTDQILCQGDFNNKILGLQAWIPYGGVTSSDAFAGYNGNNTVNRSVDPVRLAGNWLDGTTLTVEEALINATINVAQQGGEIDHVFMGYNKFGQLLKSQAAKQVIIEEANPDVSFEGIVVYTPSGKVVVVPDRNCPPNYMFGLKLDSWEYIHLGDPVQVFDFDGNTWLRQTSSDGMEIRFFSLGNLVCKEPRSNIIIKVQP